MAVFTSIGIAIGNVALAAGLSLNAAVAIGVGAANLAQAAVVSLVLNALTPRPSIPKQQIRATINQATGSRTKLYGQALLGGTRAFWEVTENRLYQIIVTNHGRIDGVERFWIDGKPVTVNVDGFVMDEPYYNDNIGGIFDLSDIILDWRSGATEGGSYNDVKSIFPTAWTNDHKLQGQATIRAAFRASGPEEYSKIFPKGPQTDVQMEARGERVYDLRSASTAYSDNAALCILDYMKSADGWGIPFANFDTAIWSGFANLSDEAMTLRAGGTSPRYRLWGVVSLTDDPKSTLARMEATCSARVYQTAEGKVGIMGGKYVAPDVTITADDIFKFVLIEGTEKLDASNVVRGIYTSEPHGYQDTEAQPWEDEASLATQPERSIDFNADMVPEHAQMRRLMKLHINRSNRPFMLSITTNLVGIKARFPRGEGYHVIRVQNPDMGFDEACEVVSHKTYSQDMGDGALQWRCQIELAGIDPAWNDWDAIVEEGDAPIAPAILEADGTPVPTIVELSQFAAGTGAGIRVKIADINRPDLIFTAQIRLSPSGVWSGMVESDLVAESVGRVVGNTYDVRVKYNGGAYSAPVSITIV
jgi:hypothetical protein